MSLRRIAVLAISCLLAAAASGGLGLGYRERLSDPRGFFQVTVSDGTAGALPGRPPRPRRTVVAVLDGLGHVDAAALGALAHLGARGQCREMDVGPLPLSRPSYATLSTGLEADRHGCRDNGCRGPLVAESVWRIARDAGLRVSAVSDVSWWRDSFPDGFDEYRIGGRAEDLFVVAPPADLQLVHPVYLDETAHEHGTASPEFAAALRRADGELWRLLGDVNLARDLVVVTADHGHVVRGGHGGRQDRVARVLTCLAGPGVARRADRPPMSAMPATALAPSLALLLGLPFPAQMRAGQNGDDGLDALWEIADPAQLAAPYLGARRAAVTRFRDANAAQLQQWDPASDGRWPDFYAHARAAQRLRALPAVALIVLVVALLWRARERGPGALGRFTFGLLWVAGVFALGVALYVALRGSFDLSSVSTRARFLRFTALLGSAVGVGAAALHLLLRRRPEALLREGAALMAVGAVICLCHPLAYGYHVGFPIPAPPAYFFPFFAPLFLVPMAALGFLGCVVALVAGLRREKRGAAAPTE